MFEYIKQPISGWWSAQSQRDRRIILIALPAALVLSFYVFIWLPFIDEVNLKKNRVVAERSLLAWMQGKVQEIDMLRGMAVQKGDLGGQSLLSAVDGAVRTSELLVYVDEVAQAGDDAVRVRFTAVPFDALIAWLQTLREQLGIGVDQVTIDRGEETGLVDVRVTLKAG